MHPSCTPLYPALRNTGLQEPIPAILGRRKGTNNHRVSNSPNVLTAASLCHHIAYYIYRVIVRNGYRRKVELLQFSKIIVFMCQSIKCSDGYMSRSILNYLSQFCPFCKVPNKLNITRRRIKDSPQELPGSHSRSARLFSNPDLPSSPLL